MVDAFVPLHSMQCIRFIVALARAEHVKCIRLLNFQVHCKIFILLLQHCTNTFSYSAIYLRVKPHLHKFQQHIFCKQQQDNRNFHSTIFKKQNVLQGNIIFKPDAIKRPLLDVVKKCAKKCHKTIVESLLLTDFHSIASYL